MASDFSVYCIKSVASPPQAMSRRKESGEFYCHIDVPIPEQLVIFSEGLWEDRKDFDVILRYKDDEVQLGHINRSNSCLSWRRDSTLPACMLSESEKGVAKLVLENSTGPPVLEKMTPEQAAGSSVHGDAAKQTEENSSPNRGTKNKRKSSLGKDGKVANGPTAKKQKVQSNKVSTRVRNQKTESQDKVDSQEKKENATKKEKLADVIDEVKPESSTTEKKGKKGSPEITVEKKGRRASKTGLKDKSNEESCEKVIKDTKIVVKDEAKDKKVKKEKTDVKQDKSDTDSSKEKKKEKTDIKQDKSDTDSSKEKKSRKDSKTEVKDSPSEPTNEKKKCKGSKAELKGKAEAEVDENKNKKETKTESPTVVDTDGSQTKKRGRKGRKDQVKEETKADKCDKENVNVNLPALSTQLQKPVFALSNAVQKATTNLVESREDIGSKKMAVCKDLTYRTLARPTGRWGHSLCFVNRNLSVLIGGQGEKQQLNKDSVWMLDAETRRWKSTTTQSEGQKPEYRMGHTATYDPMVRCIYVFGGSKNTRWFHDVHVLDIDEWKWQLVKVNGKAPTRAYHSATLYRHELWIFGGVYPRPDPQPDGCSGDIHIFSPVMESWYSPIVKGEKPLPRSGHSATLLNDQLVVFGGWDAPISYSDLHILDMSIVEWTQPEFKGTPPSPRSWHASCALTGNRLLIHGGYNGDFALEDTHIFNMDKMEWCQIQVESKPTARVGHRALCMPYRHDNEEEDEIIIFGGGDNDGEYFDDLMSIYVPFDPVPVTSS